MRAVPFVVLVTVALAACLACVAATTTGTALATRHDIAGTPGTTPTLRPPYRCVHDELQRRIRQSGMPMARIMRRTAAGGTERIANASAEGDWAPLRIAVFTQDLYIAGHYCSTAGENVSTFDGRTRNCTDDDILTPAKRNTLVRYLLPSAVGLHERYLQVQRISGSVIVVPNFTGAICRTFTIPSAHHTDGVSNADFVLYAASTPAYDNGVAAWAATCTLSDDDGRPIVGVTNIMTKYIDRSSETARTASHELLHALGFSIDNFQQAGMVTVTSIRGKPNEQYVVNSTNVVREARTHYNCSTLQWMELEDEGGPSTVGSHWERRNAKDEVMAGVVGIGYYTALTIAAMEDLGYYKGNYTNAEIMPWGRNAGCDLLNEKCMTDNITKYPDMFCNDTSSTLQCTSDRLSIGRCLISQARTTMPDYYHYFVSPMLVGADQFVDYCPIITPFSDTSCVSTNILDGMTLGATSRCLDATNTSDQRFYVLRGVCANVTCDAATSTYQVTFAGSSEPLDCPEGSTIDLSTTGAALNTAIVTCAPYDEVCGIHDVELNDSDSSSDSAPPPVSSSSDSSDSNSASSSASSSSSSSSSDSASPSASGSSSSSSSDSASPPASGSSSSSDSASLSASSSSSSSDSASLSASGSSSSSDSASPPASSSSSSDSASPPSSSSSTDSLPSTTVSPSDGGVMRDFSSVSFVFVLCMLLMLLW